jgi:hypothetical protein
MSGPLPVHVQLFPPHTMLVLAQDDPPAQSSSHTLCGPQLSVSPSQLPTPKQSTEHL